MTPMEFLMQEIKEEIKRLEDLEEERLRCHDYAGALRRQSEREACLRIWNIACVAYDRDKKERLELDIKEEGV